MTKTNTKDAFIEKSNLRHNNRYNYDNVVYITNKKKVLVGCPEHGDFWIRPDAHICGRGCRKCSYVSRFVKGKSTRASNYVSKCKEVHGDVYDYTKTFYKTATEKVTITCKKHGEYKITPSNHLAGSGCKLCGREKTRNSLKSAHENLLFKLLSLVFDDIEQSNRKILRGLEIDILRYSNKKCIEFNGDYWHCNPNKYSSDFKIRQSNKTATEIWESDKNKRILLNSLGYDLLVVWESDWKQDKMKIVEMCIEFLQGV
jgi:G:T-mismatch repair DNA endonuclease (very short patch repair protein)